MKTSDPSTPNPRDTAKASASASFWAATLFEEMINDIRYGFRQALKNKLHTGIIVATLALCLGSNTTAYNFLRNLVTNPYDYGEVQDIVQVGKKWAKLTPVVGNLSVHHYFFLKERCTDIFTEIGFVDDDNQFDLDLGNRVRRIRTDLITPEIFSITQIQPLAGRFFTQEDVEGASGRLIVLGERLWNDLRSDSDDMIGKDVVLDGQSYQVIGVAPESFYLSYQRSEAWIPRLFEPKEIEETWRRNNHSYISLARLKPGVTVEQANHRLNSIYEAFLDKFPEDRDDQERSGATFASIQIGGIIIQNLPQLAVAFRSVQVVTLIVLLIGCLNVSGMILVRSFSRIQEFAMRRALGASVRRLTMQILTEIIIYFLLGALFSVFVLQAGFMAASVLNLDQIPWAGEFEVDANSLQVTFLIAFASALLTGIIPVVSVLKRDLMEHVKSGGRTVSGSAAKHRMHASFVISQVTLSVILLVLAGVLIQNMNAVMQKNIGFSKEGRIALEVQQPGYRFGTDWDSYLSNVNPFREKVLEKLRAVPGVVNASVSNRVPITPFNSGHSTFSMDHYEYAQGEEHANGLRVVVFPGYFQTVGTKILQGRDFLDTDTHESEKVVIIDQTLVDKYYQGVNPVGQTIDFWGETLKIIGVVERVQSKPYFIQDRSVSLYFSARQWDMDRYHTHFIVHTSGDVSRLEQALRQAILEVDPKVTMEIRTLQDMFEIATFAQQLPMVMTLFFATIAVLLTGIGLYGLISFTVMERTKEYGIRMALGAKPSAILRRILRASSRLIAAGLVVGLLISLAICIRINPLLVDIHTVQPLIFAVVVLFVAGICALASMIPALRATRVNVIDTLRYE